MGGRRLTLIALVVFVAAVAGVFVGRQLFAASPRPERELHEVLHDRLSLDTEQKRRLHTLEAGFAERRRVLETEMRAENARIARAIAAEHRIGPEVTAAVDASHRTMGALQKETLAHVFAMRRLMRPDQAATFDVAVTKALTEEAK